MGIKNIDRVYIKPQDVQKKSIYKIKFFWGKYRN